MIRIEHSGVQIGSKKHGAHVGHSEIIQNSIRKLNT